MKKEFEKKKILFNYDTYTMEYQTSKMLEMEYGVINEKVVYEKIDVKQENTFLKRIVSAEFYSINIMYDAILVALKASNNNKLENKIVDDHTAIHYKVNHFCSSTDVNATEAFKIISMIKSFKSDLNFIAHETESKRGVRQ